jgi:hypothetical protein
MGLLGDFGRGVKDSAVSLAATQWMNMQLADYGKIVSFKLDSSTKRVAMEALLKGEKEPVRVCVEQYEVVRDGTDAFVRFASVETSRDWLNTLLRQIVLPRYAPDNQVRIPAAYASIVDKLT